MLGKAPFPLNYILPWTQQREVQRKFGRLDMAEVGVGGRSGLLMHGAICTALQAKRRFSTLPHTVPHYIVLLKEAKATTLAHVFAVGVF